LFNLHSRSQLSLSLTRFKEVLFAGFGSSFCWEEGREEKHTARHAAATGRLWEEKGSPSLSPYIYTSH